MMMRVRREGRRSSLRSWGARATGAKAAAVYLNRTTKPPCAGLRAAIVRGSCAGGRSAAQSPRVMKKGEYCVIAEDVTIGEGTRVGNFVLIRADTRVGTGCTIGSY